MPRGTFGMNDACNRLSLLLFALLLPGVAFGTGREPVLKQIDLPHSYYWRELYLPQLTTGPSAASFLPDSQSLVYSMAGSLWRQALDSEDATELTHAIGAYDYQPDVASDGRSVVFVRYDGITLELWRLDLASGREQALTSGGAVNVEPRLSPNGHKLAWVSTEGSGHFNLYLADIDASGLHGTHRVIDEHQSTIVRSILRGRRMVSLSILSATTRSPGARAISMRSRSPIPHTRRKSSVKRPVGMRVRNSHLMATGCSSPAITDARRSNCG